MTAFQEYHGLYYFMGLALDVQSEGAQLAERPYTAGELYFLPCETFTRLQPTPESYANGWASEQYRDLLN